MRKIISIISLCLISTLAFADPYAVVNQNGNVINVIEWDGQTDYTPPAGDDLVLDTKSQVGIGWTYSNGTFSPPVPPAPTAAQQAASALTAGIIVISTGTPSLNGTYGLDQTAQNNVSATTTYILLNGTFPNGNATMPWIDKNGIAHIWPNVAEFKAFATVYANYVAAVALYMASNGAASALPSNTVTIP